MPALCILSLAAILQQGVPEPYIDAVILALLLKSVLHTVQHNFKQPCRQHI